MLDESALARMEVERHQPQMLYAERQMLKAGAYEEAIESLMRRSRRRKLGIAVYAALLVANVLLGGGALGFLVLAVVMLAAAAHEQSHLARTLETIRRLKPQAGATDGDAREPRRA